MLASFTPLSGGPLATPPPPACAVRRTPLASMRRRFSLQSSSSIRCAIDNGSFVDHFLPPLLPRQFEKVSYLQGQLHSAVVVTRRKISSTATSSRRTFCWTKTGTSASLTSAPPSGCAGAVFLCGPGAARCCCVLLLDRQAWDLRASWEAVDSNWKRCAAESHMRLWY